MKSLFTLSIFILSVIYINAQAPAIEWQKSIGGSGNDGASIILQTQDGGYIVAGTSSSNDHDVSGNHGGQDYWIVKMDSVGNITWQKSFGGSVGDLAYSIIQTQDGGYIVAGFSYSNNGDVSGNHGGSDNWVLKLDTLGNLIWQKCIGGSSFERVSSIIQTQDGEYVLAGYSSSNNGDVSGNHGGNDYWIVKLDTLGNISWQKSLGGSGEDLAFTIIQNQNGEYLIAGSSNSNNGDVSGNHGSNDSWIVKLDAFGNITWQKSLGGSDLDNAYTIIQTQDGGYIIAGSSKSNNGDVSGNHGGYDFWIAKLDSVGNINWQKSLGGSSDDFAYTIKQTQDGNYILVGSASSNNGNVSGNHGGYDYWIIKLDTLGNISWQKTLGGSSDDYNYPIIQTQDGGYIVSGQSFSVNGDITGNHGNSDYWIVKLEPENVIITGENQNIVGLPSLTLYPNPASEILMLELEGQTQENYQIFDLQGKLVLQGAVSQGKNIVNIASLSKGSYVIRTESSGMPFEVVK